MLLRKPFMSDEGYQARKQKLGKMGEYYEESTAGDPAAFVGELGGEIGLMAAPASKIAKAGKGAQLGLGGKSALTGGRIGAVSAGLHASGDIGRGKPFNPLAAIGETVGSAVIPGVGSKAGPYLKGKGEKIVETAFKAGRKVKGQKVMDKTQLKTFFDKYASYKGAIGSEKLVEKEQKLLGKEFGNIINNLGKGKSIDASKAINDARNRIERQVKTLKISGTEKTKIFKQLDEFQEDLQPFLKNDKLSFKGAQKFKKNIIDPMSKWDKPTPLGEVDPDLIAKAKGARSVRGKLTKQMVKEVPELGVVNKKYAEMASVRPFIEQAAERVRANRGLSMQDVGALGLGGLGMGGAAFAEKPAYGLVALLPFLYSRAQKSPAVAKFLYQLGQGADLPKKIPQEVKQILMQAGRTSATSQLGGNQ
jgi:hypothetical protein